MRTWTIVTLSCIPLVLAASAGCTQARSSIEALPAAAARSQTAAATAVPEEDKPTERPFVTAAELVGEYWYSEFLQSYRLNMLPEGRFRWESRACVGAIASYEGTYEVTDRLVVLNPVDPEVTIWDGKRYIPVRWGNRTYLIPEAIRDRFRDAVLRGAEPRSHMGSDASKAYLRRDDWEKPVSGVPRAPTAWNDLFRGLVAKRVEARVTTVWTTTWHGGDFTLTTDWASLDAGWNQGLKSGMWLIIPASPGAELGSHFTRLFPLQEVEKETSEAKIILRGSGPAGMTHGVEVGDVATMNFCVIDPAQPARKLSPDEKRAQQAAERLIAQVAGVYGTCRSYRDKGVIRTVFIKEDGQETHLLWFSTAFVRPDRFRFAYGDHKGSKKAPCNIVSRDGASVRTWDRHIEEMELPAGSLGGVLGGWTGVSSGSSTAIPWLLMPSDLNRSNLRQLAELRLIEDEELDGTKCSKVAGTGHGGTRYTIWIERDTKLIRQIREETQFATFRSVRTTTYSSQINVDIVPDDLVFDPPE